MANQFPRSIPNHVVVSSTQTTVGQTPYLLSPLQLGLFDADSFQVTSTLTNRVILAVGSPHTGEQTVGGLLGNFANLNEINSAYKSEAFKIQDIVEIDQAKAVTATRQQISYLGYDGINLCQGINFKCGKSYNVNIQLSGQPVEQLTGIGALPEIFSVKCDDCAACPTGCLTNDVKVKYLNKLVNNINTDTRFVNRFVRASPVVRYCTPPASVTKTWYAKFQTTVCDGSDVVALAAAKRQTTNKTKRINDTAIPNAALSTYETDWYLIPAVAGASPTAAEQAAAAPANLVLNGFILPNCTICPTGATSVAAGTSYAISIMNAGAGTNAATWLTEVQAAYPSATAATRQEYINGISYYTATFPAAFVTPTPVASTTIYYLGVTAAYCVLPTTNYPWTPVDTAYKIIRKLQVVVTNALCVPDITTLPLLQSLYANDTSVVPGSAIVSTPTLANPSAVAGTDGCKTIYEIQQYSNLLQDGCDWTALASYLPLQPFNGFLWEIDVCKGWTLSGTGCPVPPVSAQDDVVMGIRFDVIFYRALPQGAAYSIYDHDNKNPVFLFASFTEALSQPNGILIDLGVPFKITQQYQKENLKGHSILKSIILTGYYKGEHYVDQEYKLLESMGYKRAIDPNKFYNYVKIVFDTQHHNAVIDSKQMRHSYYFYYDTNDVPSGQAIKDLINRLAEKNGSFKLLA